MKAKSSNGSNFFAATNGKKKNQVFAKKIKFDLTKKIAWVDLNM